MGQTLESRPTDWRRLYSTNTTATAFVTRTDTLTKPSGDGVFDLQAVYGSGPEVPNCAQFQFFGVGSNDNTGLVRVYAVSPVVENGVTTAWHYTPLFSGTFTLNSSLTGVAGGPVSASNFYADTLTRTVGSENVGDAILSPGDSTGAATLLVDTKAQHLFFVEVHTNSSSTSVNALARGV